MTYVPFVDASTTPSALTVAWQTPLISAWTMVTVFFLFFSFPTVKPSAVAGYTISAGGSAYLAAGSSGLIVLRRAKVMISSTDTTLY